MTSKILTIMIGSMCSFLCKAQTYGRGYEVTGLPKSNTVADSLMIGVPLLIIGFVLAWLFMWKDANNGKPKEGFPVIGIIGLLIMGLGFVFLLPLLVWIEAIGGILISIAILIGIILFVCSLFKRK